MSPFTGHRSTVILFPALVAVALGLALWIRYGLIENAALGRACDAAGVLAACPVRQTSILLFNYNAFGWVAVMAAAVTLWRPTVVTASIAVVAAAMGLVLYNTSMSALAIGLMVLALARPGAAIVQRPATQARP